MRNSRLKKAVGLLLPLCTFTGVALAHHDLMFTASVSPATAGAVADTSGHSESGTFIPASSILHMPAGALVAHAADSTSPVSPPPLHGDVVGQVKNYGDLWNDGCGNYITSIATVTWVEPIGSGAPAGAVAELKLQATPLPGLTITKRAFVVKSNGDTFQSGAHYDINIPDMPDEFACSGSSSIGDMTTYGFARSGGVTTNRVVGRNPATPGTYNVFIEYKDKSGALHQDASSITVR
jgi:hypothetical protein